MTIAMHRKGYFIKFFQQCRNKAGIFACSNNERLNHLQAYRRYTLKLANLPSSLNLFYWFESFLNFIETFFLRCLLLCTTAKKKVSIKFKKRATQLKLRNKLTHFIQKPTVYYLLHKYAHKTNADSVGEVARLFS